jgi:hypothetical protein
MFSWSDFSAAAIVTGGLAAEDRELRSILSQPHPPAVVTNDIGQPSPGSVVICQHTDIPNYKRMIGIRRQIAAEKHYRNYVSYADSVLGFLDSTPGLATLFVVVIATDSNLYEFLFSPETRRILGAPFQASDE